MPTFVSKLQSQQAIAAPALEFIILTAIARAGEALGARWEEFDLERAVWTVPAARMKGGRKNRVPLSQRALKIIKAMHKIRNGDFVFAGRKPGKHLTVRAPLNVAAPHEALPRQCTASVPHFVIGQPNAPISRMRFAKRLLPM